MPTAFGSHVSMFCVLALGAVIGLSMSAALSRPAHAEDKKAERYFEMRIYTANDGKLEALHARFRDHTNKLFVKHGMDLVGYWTPVDGAESKNTLIYILGYPSKEAREKSWADFQADPDWKAAKAASEVNGSLVAKVETKFLAPTDYSPIK